jgi:hypothetical protein
LLNRIFASLIVFIFLSERSQSSDSI